MSTTVYPKFKCQLSFINRQNLCLCVLIPITGSSVIFLGIENSMIWVWKETLTFLYFQLFDLSTYLSFQTKFLKISDGIDNFKIWAVPRTKIRKRKKLKPSGVTETFHARKPFNLVLIFTIDLNLTHWFSHKS